MTSLTSSRAACEISARSFGLPTNYERPILTNYFRKTRMMVNIWEAKSVIICLVLVILEYNICIIMLSYIYTVGIDNEICKKLTFYNSIIFTSK